MINSRALVTAAPILIAVSLSACAGLPPSPALVIGPDAATTTDDLVLSVTDSAEVEADDVVDYEITWYRDGEEQADLADATTVPASATSKNETWRAVVTPIDDKERVGESVETEITVVNTAPVATVAISPEVPLTTEDLVATAPGEDADGDAITTTYSWLRDGEDAGISGDTVSADLTVRGEVWTVIAVPADDEVSGEPVEAVVSIDNTAPVAESVTLEPASPTEASTLTAVTVGTDDDGDELTWSMSWLVNGVEVATDVTSIDGDLFDKGDEVTVLATPSDGMVEGNTVTDVSTVLNTPPSLDRAAISPTVLLESETLACNATGWLDIDGDDEAYDVSWEVGGMLVSTDATLTGAFFDKGDEVVCTLTPFDGEAYGTPVSSGISTVSNTVPALTGVTFDLSTPRTNDVLTATAAGVTDDDGDAVSLTFAWSVAGSVVSTETVTGTSASLDGGSWFDRDETVTVTVTPNDGTDDGAPVSSATITVANSAPVIATAAVGPTPMYTTSTAVASVSASDDDGDEIALTVTWTVDGSSAGTGGTLGSSNFEKGEAVGFGVVATDGTDSSAATATAVTVSNTPPTAPEIAISPSAPTSADDLECTVTTAATDVDGDTITYDIEWTLDGSAWAGDVSTTRLDGDTIDAADLTDGDVWSCTATPFDGDDDGPSATSDDVTVSDCGNPGGGALVYNNGAGTGEDYCYNSGDTATTRAQKACESHFGVGNCCVITGGYANVQYGECGKGGYSGTIHWHPDNHPSGHCAPYYTIGDVVSPGWCGSVTGRFMP